MFSQSAPKWHEGEKWKRLLEIYDGIAKEQFQDGQSRLVSTTFGDTQIHMRGNPKNPPLVFFHGIATNSLMFGEWLIPRLSTDYYCVAVDTLGDMGRSFPRDGDPENGPQNEKEMADWVLQVLEKLDIHERVNIVGYSFGCCIASCVAMHYPTAVDKLILMAPAGVVAPVRKVWLAQAICFGILLQMVPQQGVLADRLRTWFFGSMMADTDNMKNLKYPELQEATEAVGGPQVKVQPQVLDGETLTKMTNVNPTLLIIGQQESVIDPMVAVDQAEKSNMKVKVYDNAGHMFFCEYPREIVIDEMKAFLSSSGGIMNRLIR